MTPRERDTLEMILHEVASYNGRPIVDVKFDPIVTTARRGCAMVLAAGDMVIDHVVFAPEHRESA